MRTAKNCKQLNGKIIEVKDASISYILNLSLISKAVNKVRKTCNPDKNRRIKFKITHRCTFKKRIDNASMHSGERCGTRHLLPIRNSDKDEVKELGRTKNKAKRQRRERSERAKPQLITLARSATDEDYYLDSSY